MNKKCMISFVLFSITALAFIYITLPEIILPICGLFAVYLIIHRKEVKEKAKSKYSNAKSKAIVIENRIKQKVSMPKKIGATTRNNP